MTTRGPWILPGIVIGLMFLSCAGGLWFGLTVGNQANPITSQSNLGTAPGESRANPIPSQPKLGPAPGFKVGQNGQEPRLPEEKVIATLLRERCPEVAKLEFVTWGPHDLEGEDRPLGAAKGEMKRAKILRLVFRTANKKGGISNHDALFFLVDGHVELFVAHAGADWKEKSRAATDNPGSNTWNIIRPTVIEWFFE